jgi:hypothetical protein
MGCAERGLFENAENTVICCGAARRALAGIFDGLFCRAISGVVRGAPLPVRIAEEPKVL